MMVSKSKHDTNGFKSSNRCKGFTKINTLNLSVSLRNKSCLVSDDLAIFIKLVAENPLCADDVVNPRIRPLDQFPNIIQFELKEFILHVLIPLRFLECLYDFSGF